MKGDVPQTSLLRFKVVGKRGGKHPFSSDDAKRAASRGLLTAAASSRLVRAEVGGEQLTLIKWRNLLHSFQHQLVFMVVSNFHM